MIDFSKIDYSKLDRPEILMFLFHPRPEWSSTKSITGTVELSIPVEKGVAVGGRFHSTEKAAPIILFFHGNGEIVADYDDLGQLYTGMGINFLPVDYRGYGRSTGKPTITAMMGDCHRIFDYVQDWLSKNSYSGPLIIMGRSLGSASALELSVHHASRIDGLIIESGFAYFGPLLRLLGVNMDAMGIREEEGFNNIEKISSFSKHTLIIHAENDNIIPFSEGQALFNASGDEDKSLLMIPGANHNDIFFHGMSEYMKAIEGLVKKIVSDRSQVTG